MVLAAVGAVIIDFESEGAALLLILLLQKFWKIMQRTNPPARFQN